jgi:hypothetical protein
MTDPVPGTVKLLVYDKNLGTTNMPSWTLSPGVTISRFIQKDNFNAPIALGGFVLLDMGLPSQNTVTITGVMTYNHNTKKPLDVFEEIYNQCFYHAAKSTDPASTNGWFSLQIEEDITEGNFIWDGLVKSVNWDIESGQGNMVNYTIIMDLATAKADGS